MENNIYHGYVKTFNGKCFGMIQQDNGDMVFLNSSEIVHGTKFPRAGQLVSYRIKTETDPKHKPRAVAVTVSE